MVRSCWWQPEIRQTHQLRLNSLKSHYIFTTGFSTIPGGWPWDFWTIHSMAYGSGCSQVDRYRVGTKWSMQPSLEILQITTLTRGSLTKICAFKIHIISYIYNLHTTTRKQTTTHSQTTNVLNILITGFVSSNKCVTHIASLNFSHLENANREDTPNSLRREVPRLR